MSNTEVFLSIEDFKKQARRLAGSHDFGAQLFCALLRSAAVEARLVCSLQPLPFSGTTKDMSPGKPKSYYASISTDGHESSSNETSRTGISSNLSRPGARRLGQPHFAPLRPAATSVTGRCPCEIWSSKRVLTSQIELRNLQNHHTRCFGLRLSTREPRNGSLSIPW